MVWVMGLTTCARPNVEKYLERKGLRMEIKVFFHCEQWKVHGRLSIAVGVPRGHGDLAISTLDLWATYIKCGMERSVQ